MKLKTLKLILGWGALLIGGIVGAQGVLEKDIESILIGIVVLLSSLNVGLEIIRDELKELYNTNRLEKKQ